MKMEKLNDYQIKFLLSKQDLLDRNITFSDLFRHSDKLQRLVREIMKLASERINFNVTENPVMVEARPHPDGIVLIVSRTPEKNDELITDEYKRHLASLYNDFVENRVFDSGSGTTPAPEASEDAVTNYIYTFTSFSKLVSSCKLCAGIYKGKSTLCKLNDKYYLVLSCLPKEHTAAVSGCLSEYGDTRAHFSTRPGFVSEYGDIIICENAISTLAGC